MTEIVNRLPRGVTPVPAESTPLKETIERAISERLAYNRGTKLTWNPQKLPIAGEAKMLGGVCLSLPYHLIERKYYVQNLRFFRTNGDEVTKDEIYELEGGGPIFLRCIEAWDKMAEEAAKSDPNLCHYCFLFTANTHDEYVDHLLHLHPDVMMDKAKHRQDAPKERFVCLECERDFQSATAMDFHKWKKHGAPPPGGFNADRPSKPVEVPEEE